MVQPLNNTDLFNQPAGPEYKIIGMMRNCHGHCSGNGQAGTPATYGLATCCGNVSHLLFDSLHGFVNADWVRCDDGAGNTLAIPRQYFDI